MLVQMMRMQKTNKTCINFKSISISKNVQQRLYNFYTIRIERHAKLTKKTQLLLRTNNKTSTKAHFFFYFNKKKET